TSSRTPFLMPWSWSPVRAKVRNRKQSTISATVTSDWPTPTVSTSTTSNPAASMRIIVSRVARATPPNVPAEGEGRTNAFGSVARRVIRVLSPRMLPPVRTEEGSTASTATLCPRPVSMLPSASTNVDLPTPGTPVMPTRGTFPLCGSGRSGTRWAAAAGADRGGVHGEHGHLVPPPGQHAAQRVDERGLAHPGHPGDAHPVRVPAVRQQPDQQLLGQFRVVGAARLHQGDRPRQGGP